MKSNLARKTSAAVAFGLLLGLATAPQGVQAQEHGHHDDRSGGTRGSTSTTQARGERGTYRGPSSSASVTHTDRSNHPWYGNNNRAVVHGQADGARNWRGGDNSAGARDQHDWRSGRDDHGGGQFDWHGDRRFSGYNGVRLGFYFAPGHGYYHVPDQYYGHRWSRGEYLPSFFFDYRIDDFGYYDLPPPPYGCAYYFVGQDAVLVDLDTGEIIKVIYGVY